MASDIKALETGEVLPSENGIRQLADAIGSYPLSRIAEGALNSNPLHQVIPKDWAEVVRALRTLWLYGAEKDHIVPWDAAWRIQQLVAGKTRFVLASSGHIAGIINPPGGKGTYWTNGDETDTPARWRERNVTKAAGGRTGLHGSPTDQVPRGSPTRWGVDIIRRCRMRQEVTS
jgi:hypothetical protein